MSILYTNNVAPHGTEYNTWFTTYTSNGRRELDSVDTINDFFTDLNTGDYVRYGNYDDSTPSNGMHSIVFVSKDENGIWAYECNQKYYDDLPADRKDDHDAGDFGCGIHLQYYTFGNIKSRYNYALYYVKHNYNEAPVYDDATYHKVGCSHCVGYLRQTHDGTTYQVYDRFRHRVNFTCCGGSVLAMHNYVYNGSGSYVCTACYADRDGFFDILSLEQLATLYDA